jgi:hypothetical protein
MPETDRCARWSRHSPEPLRQRVQYLTLIGATRCDGFGEWEPIIAAPKLTADVGGRSLEKVARTLIVPA